MDFENNLKQFLKENGSTEDEIMSRKEMMDLQTAINNSKDTANLENEKRESIRQAEEMQKDPNSDITDSSPDKSAKDKSFNFKKWDRTKSPVDIFEIQDEFINKEKFEITFQDMLRASKESLKVIYHNPIYDLPIPTNARYQKYSLRERVKFLYDYHSKISDLKIRLAKKSLHRAPYSSPISSSVRCKNSLMKSASEDENETVEEPSDHISTEEFYVSRAGRQVKRKIYTEDNEVDSDSDFTSSVKKNKSFDSDTKITIDTPYVPEENDKEKTPPRTAKTRKDTPKRPPALSAKKATGRSDIMFENLMNESTKMKQKEKQMANFEKTLPTLVEDDEKMLLDDSPVKESPAEDGDENFIRKRVVPPVPTRKTTRSKKQITQEDFDKIDLVPGTPPLSPVLKKYTNLNRTSNNSPLKAQKSKENLLTEETSICKLDKRDCPICGKEFLQSEIVNHASSCGIDDVIAGFPYNDSDELSSEQIKCDLCDKVFPVNTSYEVHVKQCIASKITDM